MASAIPEPMVWALRLTLANLLLQPIGPWWLRGGILSLALLGLLWPRVLALPALWLTLALLTGARVIADWPLSDNHAYLMSYWCLACGLALYADRPVDALARNACWLLGLVFLWASIWKIVGSADYGSGLFFRVTMVMDPRLEGFARLVGGLSGQELELLRDYVGAHVDGNLLAAMAAPEVPRRFAYVAQAAAWWNMFINAALAVAFLAPAQWLVSRARNVLLLVYCISTYAVATVAGFGWLLIAMAVSQTEADERRLRIAYVATFVLILLYREIPWSQLLLA
ncbi:MAG: hypothetical protein ABJ308_03045 [Halieaceae bacterium]